MITYTKEFTKLLMDDKPTVPDWATPPSAPPIQNPPPPAFEPTPKSVAPSVEQPLSAQVIPVTTPPPPPPGPNSASRSSSGVAKRILKVGLGVLVVGIIVLSGFFGFSFIKNKISPQAKVVTLNYWGLWEDKNTMQAVFSDFEREHANIKVNYEQRDIKQYRETLKTRLAGGSGPDIFRFHNSWLPMFETDLVALPKTVLGENPKDDFYPTVSRDLVKNGAYLGIPLEIDTLLLFVNRDLVSNAPPKTWNDLKNLAPSLTVKDIEGKIKTAGVSLGTYDNIDHASDIISLMFLQNGVDFKKIDETSSNLTDALEFYTSFAKKGSGMWDDTLDPSLLGFAKGNVALTFGYSWDIFSLRAVNPNLNFQVVPVPQLEENNKIAVASYWAEGVSKKSKNQKAAFELLAYLNKNEVAQKLYSQEAKTRLFGEPSAKVEVGKNLASNPYLAGVVEQAKYARGTPFSSNTFDNGLNSELNKYLGDAVRGILSNTSPESAVETLKKGIHQVFDKYGVR